MWKVCCLCFDSQSDRRETSVEMTLRLAMVGVAHQEETVFDVVNLKVVKWPGTKLFKDLPSVKTITDLSQDTTLQSMSNDSIDLTCRLVTSYEEHFSQPNPECLAAMCSRPLFAGSGFEQLKPIHESEGDWCELMK